MTEQFSERLATLKAAAEKAKSMTDETWSQSTWHNYQAATMPDVILALIEELEAASKWIPVSVVPWKMPQRRRK